MAALGRKRPFQRRCLECASARSGTRLRARSVMGNIERRRAISSYRFGDAYIPAVIAKSGKRRQFGGNERDAGNDVDRH